MDLIVGLDVGTTSAKAVAFSDDGEEHGSGEAGYPLHEPEPGRAEQDPREVIEAAVTAAAGAVQAADDAGRRVAGISLCTAMHSLIGLDGDDRPVTPLVTWADGRAAEQAARLRREQPELHARTGTPLHPMAPLAKLVWFAEHDPDAFGRARRWVGLKELLIHRLTGRWLTEASCASGTGLMSLETLDWDEQALAAAGIGADRLCPILPTTEVLKLSTGDLGLPADTPVVAGAGDGPLANLGLGAVRPGVAACSIGTSGALRLIVENAGIDSAGRLFCYALSSGRWALGGAINNGGSVLAWAGAALAPELGSAPEEPLLEAAAQVPAGSQGLVMLPYLLSERAPHWDVLARGAYVGLRHFHHRGHLVRAALEGVCQQLALVLGSMRDAGAEIREIRATGGFARSVLWRQILTDALGMPIQFASAREGSAFGAALLGMEALGLVDSIEQAAQLVQVDETTQPDPEAAQVYRELLPLFSELYDELTPAFGKLQRIEHQTG